MIYLMSSEIKQLKPGDIVWGFNFSHERNTGRAYTEPIKGEIVNDSMYGNMFIPFKENGKQLDYNKADVVRNMCFATTRNEAETSFCNMITAEVEEHVRKMKELIDIKNDFIKRTIR